MSVSHQATVAHPAAAKGIGLHTGRQVRLELSPGPADSGIVFIREDLPGRPEIAATPDAVDLEAGRRTELKGPGGAGAAMIEHLLAACLGLGIDNLRVALNGPELPIFDGSALPYVELLARAGRRELDAPRRAWRLRRPVVLDTGRAQITAVPATAMSLAFFADLAHAGLPDQAAEFQLGSDDFAATLAPARTWCLYEEVEALRAKGLIRGGSLDCAVVLRDGKPMETAWRLDRELARHKLLDFLGDLAILGRPVHALLTARGSGHQLHHRFIQLLRKELVT